MNEEVKSTAELQSGGPFHTQFRVLLVMLIVEDPTVTLECRTAIKVLFLYFNIGLSCKAG